MAVSLYLALRASGMSPTTLIVIRKETGGQHAARMGFAIFGCANMSARQMAAAGHDPFHQDWTGNVCEGFGETSDDAVADLESKCRGLIEGLWA